MTDDAEFCKLRRKKEIIVDGVKVSEPVLVTQTVCKPGIIREGHPIKLNKYSKCLRLEGSYWSVLPKEKVDRIYSNTFSSLPDLTTIIISQVDLEVIEPNAFKGLQNLVYLNLYRNKLTKLPEHVFDDVPNLIRLNLEDNKIEAIDVHLFDKLNKLLNLEFALNKLSELPKGWCSGLTSLKNLRLTTNELKVIKSGMFEGLSTLEKLDLGVNGIEVIEKDAFKGLNKLQKLCLIYNGKISVDLVHELSNLPSLKEISLCSDGFNKEKYVAAEKIMRERDIEVCDMGHSSSYPSEVLEGFEGDADSSPNPMCC